MATAVSIILFVDRFTGLPEIMKAYIIEKQHEGEVKLTIRKSEKAKDIQKYDNYLLIVFSKANLAAIECEPDYFYYQIIFTNINL